MKFLKENRRFDFVYGETAFADLSCSVTGGELTETGFPVIMKEKRSAKIFFYKKV